MAFLLAIASAAFYGAGDFLGGLASRRTNTIAVVVWSQGAGLVALLFMIGVLPEASPSRVDLVWGGVAGLAGSVGVGLLYHALAIGTMAVVAPTTAVCAVAIPVMAGVLGGERLAAMTAVGMGLAVAAIVLVSRESNGAPRARARQLPRGVGIALLSGVAIGLFFLALARTSPAAGMWPLVASRSLSLVLFGAIAVATAQPLRMASPVARLATGGGVVDMAANALYLASTRYGALSVVVTLASLYPASTVILARVILGERLSRWQITGVLCALVAIVLIVSGE
jgi:drug/metabolite transporter (DMT)-like permease